MARCARSRAFAFVSDPRRRSRVLYPERGSERGPVALPVFKIGRCPLTGQAGFDSQALPPARSARWRSAPARQAERHRLRLALSARLPQLSSLPVAERSAPARQAVRPSPVAKAHGAASAPLICNLISCLTRPPCRNGSPVQERTRPRQNQRGPGGEVQVISASFQSIERHLLGGPCRTPRW